MRSQSFQHSQSTDTESNSNLSILMQHLVAAHILDTYTEVAAPRASGLSNREYFTHVDRLCLQYYHTRCYFMG